MNDIVAQLYAGEWTSSLSKAATLVAAADAPTFVRELTLSNGWRERVVAAKIAAAFQLRELVEPLVQTFAWNPETYTAIAFSRLIASLDLAEGSTLLGHLRQACPAGEYGSQLVKIIESVHGGQTEA